MPDQDRHRKWWVFYIDPTEPQGSGWKTAGIISGVEGADEAIARTAGRLFDQPFWAFALDNGEFGAFYDLHYPPSLERPPFAMAPGRLGPSGYRADGVPT